MIHAVESDRNLETLRKPLHLDLTVNDLRIIVGCLRGVAYMMDVDDEPYLDVDALELQQKLEGIYQAVLEQSEERTAVAAASS